MLAALDGLNLASGCYDSLSNFVAQGAEEEDGTNHGIFNVLGNPVDEGNHVSEELDQGCSDKNPNDCSRPAPQAAAALRRSNDL